MSVSGGGSAATGRAIRVGLILPMFSGDPHKVLAAARAAEDLSFDGLFAFDHFFPPGAAPDRPALEAFTTLAAVAAATERVAIGTLVTRAILRPAGMVAKLAATIDLVSGGRMILGVGTGDPIDLPEHHAFGFHDLSVTDRRTQLAETLGAVKALFQGEPYPGGDLVPRLQGPLLPPPVRPGGPPVWVGAQSDQVVRMAANLADGWNGWGFEPKKFRAKADLLAEESSRAGRNVEATWAGIVLVGENQSEVEALLADRDRRGVSDGVAWAGPADAFADYLLELADAGATWAIMVLAGPAGRRQLLAERVLPRL
jgi:alkanesulfonate monooxygenase SsuD/methylene tetrahydromethanopterin reductase-like flavin-dependent oxidoreductase (luciferase family)